MPSPPCGRILLFFREHHTAVWLKTIYWMDQLMNVVTICIGNNWQRLINFFKLNIIHGTSNMFFQNPNRLFLMLPGAQICHFRNIVLHDLTLPRLWKSLHEQLSKLSPSHCRCRMGQYDLLVHMAQGLQELHGSAPIIQAPVSCDSAYQAGSVLWCLSLDYLWVFPKPKDDCSP